ncbi:MAG: hypothetical protein R3313_01800 [Candidatus Saccharimonadales bacterium]|nr:hypothetical protein [Candidatus Saccharimonadales bacterium]
MTTFREIYAQVWTLSMYVSVNVALIMFGIGWVRSLAVGGKIQWAQIFGPSLALVVVGALGPPISWILLRFNQLLAGAALNLATSEALSQGLGFPSIPNLFFSVIIGFLAIIGITFLLIELIIVTFMVYGFIISAPLVWAFSAIRGGMKWWNRWKGLMMVSFFAKSAMAWTLAFGVVAINFAPFLIPEAFEPILMPIVSGVIILVVLAIASVTAIAAPYTMGSSAHVIGGYTVPGPEPGTARSSGGGGAFRTILKTGGLLALGGFIEDKWNVIPDDASGKMKSLTAGMTAAATKVGSFGAMAGAAVLTLFGRGGGPKKGSGPGGAS